MSSAKMLVFVLIPGSFSPITSYEKVTPLLHAAGYETHAVPLLSANSEGNRKEGPATMQDDTVAIRAVISGHANNGKDVVVVMHSYAGFPGTEATKDLGKTEHHKQGKEGGFVGLVYVAAWTPPVGKTIFTLQGEPDMLKNIGEYTHFDHEAMYKCIFSDLPDAEGRKYTAEMESHSSAGRHDVLTYPGYMFIPTTCVVPDNDMVIVTSIQKENIARARSEGAKITVHDVKAGHVPLLSMPDKVAEIFIGAATLN